MINKDTQELMKQAGLGGAVSINYEQTQLEAMGLQGNGFGFDPSTSMRLFSVEIGGKKQDVVIEEITIRDNPKLPSRIQKAVIKPEHWTLIAPMVSNIFNERLRKSHKKSGSWKRGKTPLNEQFGKEISVLAWALEELDSENTDAVRKAVANWQSLSPEERWWLFLMANARYGSWPEGLGKGWRKAIGFALTDYGDDSNGTELITARINSDSL